MMNQYPCADLSSDAQPLNHQILKITHALWWQPECGHELGIDLWLSGARSWPWRPPAKIFVQAIYLAQTLHLVAFVPLREKLDEAFWNGRPDEPLQRGERCAILFLPRILRIRQRLGKNRRT